MKNPAFVRKTVKRLSKLLEPFVNPTNPESLESIRWEQSKNYYPHISIKGGFALNKAEDYFHLIQSEKLKLPKLILCKTVTLAHWKKNHWGKVATIELGKIDANMLNPK